MQPKNLHTIMGNTLYCTFFSLLIKDKNVHGYIACPHFYFLLSNVAIFSSVIGCRCTNFSIIVELRGKIQNIKTRKNIECLLVKQIVLETIIQIPVRDEDFLDLTFSTQSVGCTVACTAQSWGCSTATNSYIWSAGRCKGKLLYKKCEVLTTSSIHLRKCDLKHSSHTCIVQLNI